MIFESENKSKNFEFTELDSSVAMRYETNTYKLLSAQVKFDFESESKSMNFKFSELDSPVNTGNESDTNFRRK